jgi:hypothetical protein
MTQNQSFQAYLVTFSDNNTRANQISVTVLVCNEDEANRLAWTELSLLLSCPVTKLMRDYRIESKDKTSTEKHHHWKVTLSHCFNGEEKLVAVTAIDEEQAAQKALKSIKEMGLKLSDYDVWGCKKVAPGGSRPGAGRPPGRKTKPIRIPLENLEKAEKIDIALDILREWKLRSSLNQKSARFYFLDQAIEELEKAWGEI